jgi:hypothetical protein
MYIRPAKVELLCAYKNMQLQEEDRAEGNGRIILFFEDLKRIYIYRALTIM